MKERIRPGHIVLLRSSEASKLWPTLSLAGVANEIISEDKKRTRLMKTRETERGEMVVVCGNCSCDGPCATSSTPELTLRKLNQLRMAAA
jgi:hypothetical protein